MTDQQSLFDNTDWYAPNHFSELDGRAFYQDYLRFFDGRTAIIETNYKLLQRVEVKFHIEQLVHLIGLQKVLSQSNQQILETMAKGQIDFASLRRRSSFPQLLPRLYNYHFLHEIFLDNLYETIISTHMLVPNTQRLDAIFFKPTNSAQTRHAILGLRKIPEAYVPVTLHEIHNLKRLRVTYAKVNKITFV